MQMPFPLLTYDQLLPCFRTCLRKRTVRRPQQHRERAWYRISESLLTEVICTYDY